MDIQDKGKGIKVVRRVRKMGVDRNVDENKTPPEDSQQRVIPQKQLSGSAHLNC